MRYGKRFYVIASVLMVSLLLVSLTVTALLPPQSSGKGRGPPEKIVFIHYKNGFAKPVTECGNGVCEPGENIRKCPEDCGGGEEESSCYTFLKKGVLWKDLPQDYVINPSNSQGLSQGFVTSAMSAGAEEWDSHTSTNLFWGYSIDYAATWDSETPDGRN